MARIDYNNANATRNDPINDRLGAALRAAAAAAGIDVVRVTSGGQEAAGEGGSRTGSTRHDHGNAADVELLVGGRVLDFTNPQDQAIYRRFVTSAASNGVTGIGAGTGYMGNTRIHLGYGNPAVWGGTGENAPPPPDWLVSAYNAGAGGSTTGAQDAAARMGSQGTNMPTGSQSDRPWLADIAANWRSRAQGGHPLADRAREFFEKLRNGEKPIANGIAEFFERLSGGGQGGGVGAALPGILGPQATPAFQSPTGAPAGPTPGAPPAQPPMGAPASPASPVAAPGRFQELLAGPMGPQIRERLAGILPRLPGAVRSIIEPMIGGGGQTATPPAQPSLQPSTPRTMPSPPVMPIEFPPMPVQPRTQSPPSTPQEAQPDWNPWAMLTQQSPFGLSPPQSMPGMSDWFSNFTTPQLTPGQGTPLRPPGGRPQPMPGFGFQPRMRFAPRGTGVIG